MGSLERSIRRRAPYFRTRGRKLLSDWLDARGYGAGAELARMIGTPREVVSRLASGHRLPTLAQAIALEDATGIAPGAWK